MGLLASFSITVAIVVAIFFVLKLELDKLD